VTSPPLNRVLVGGISGAGKTTFARRLAQARGLEHIELDSLYHGPDWEPRPEFVADTAAAISVDRWVIDSTGYPAVLDLLWSRADTLVWLDLPRHEVMRRVIRRSLQRTWRREELWNGNRETITSWFSPTHPVWWAWRKHAGRRAQIAARLADPSAAHVAVVHLESARQAEEWIRAHVRT
jgi:adenylate kinase family enzyme